MNSHSIRHHKLREERDASAVVAFIDKRGHSTHANVVPCIEAIRQMGHCSGDINGAKVTAVGQRQSDHHPAQPEGPQRHPRTAEQVCNRTRAQISARGGTDRDRNHDRCR